METRDDIVRKISKQIKRWELLAKIIPIFYILIIGISLWHDWIAPKTAIYVSFGLFSAVSVIWWFWAINCIHILVQRLLAASTSLSEVKSDLNDIRKDIGDRYKR